MPATKLFLNLAFEFHKVFLIQQLQKSYVCSNRFSMLFSNCTERQNKRLWPSISCSVVGQLQVVYGGNLHLVRMA